jgi:hypothetical protein
MDVSVMRYPVQCCRVEGVCIDLRISAALASQKYIPVPFSILLPFAHVQLTRLALFTLTPRNLNPGLFDSDERSAERVSVSRTIASTRLYQQPRLLTLQ